MRVLILHNRYQQRGGEDQVAEAENALLRAHGHEVEFRSFDNDHIEGGLNKIRAAAACFYSLEGQRRVREALDSFHPDVVHVHNFFPTLSPAVFRTCAAQGVPVVHTLHNFRIQCAAATLYRNGKVCEECVQTRSVVPAIRHRCYKSSRLGSAISGASMALHARLETWETAIDGYIALTEFSANKLGAYRIPREKIHVKPNFTADRGLGNAQGAYAIFVGRLSPEKGLATVIAADGAGLLPMDLVVLGDGPMRGELELAAARPGSRLKLKGFQSREQTLAWMREAKLLLLPSQWYEAGLPLVAIEAFSLGLPVMAAAVGSTEEIVAETGSGWLFPVGDANACAEAMRGAMQCMRSYEDARMRARRVYETHHTPEANYARLLEIYGKVIASA